ncbi:MarR family winged helix-turn-helix transcriptional regulator [Agromyces atrinae]|uniref:MarR family transcriptional regulator n=1 Tax=Agromyces atrinae TaxID=592376 RepID=A0A4Q2M9F4_9MICO|nr:MarR family transcriptional regulator [Agromyces atrinae]NYD66330.1 DNA-binding MarR family transcriptional regulator [Agromyces atrinae]RXZ86651.1 MarR family transcriptional regulator [Agromyces atrinae]
MDDRHDLGRSLGALFRAWQLAVNDAVAGLPHGPRGYQILTTLATEPDEPTQAGLATLLGIDRTVLTYVIDDLAAADLVERRPDARDRRVRRIALTPAGDARRAELASSVALAEARLFPTLDAEEARVMRDLLARAATGVHGHDRDACAVVAEIMEDAAPVATPR